MTRARRGPPEPAISGCLYLVTKAPTPLRVGVWTMAGRWTPSHRRTLQDLRCDILLLTEVHVAVAVDGYSQHRTGAQMGPAKHWAAVLARGEIYPLTDPHPASAAAVVDGTTTIASVLPWPLASDLWTWEVGTHPQRMASTVEQLRPTVARPDVIWGGDWNQPLVGNNSGFTNGARVVRDEAVRTLGLQVPTTRLVAQNRVQASIDHIAVPASWKVTDAGHVPLTELSDHDAYWIQVGRPA